VWFSSRGVFCYEHPLKVSACSDRLAARGLLASLVHAVAAPATLHHPPARKHGPFEETACATASRLSNFHGEDSGHAVPSLTSRREARCGSIVMAPFIGANSPERCCLKQDLDEGEDCRQRGGFGRGQGRCLLCGQGQRSLRQRVFLPVLEWPATQPAMEQYLSVRGPPLFSPAPKHPVVRVSWMQAARSRRGGRCTQQGWLPQRNALRQQEQRAGFHAQGPIQQSRDCRTRHGEDPEPMMSDCGCESRGRVCFYVRSSRRPSPAHKSETGKGPATMQLHWLPISSDRPYILQQGARHIKTRTITISTRHPPVFS
jgi:hypothetical protein